MLGTLAGTTEVDKAALLCSSTQLVPCAFFTVHNDIYGLTLALRLIRLRA